MANVKMKKANQWLAASAYLGEEKHQ